MNGLIVPPGARIAPFPGRSDLLRLTTHTTHTVLHNLTEGVLLVSIILFFLGNIRAAIIVALTIPFSLLSASICLDLNKILYKEPCEIPSKKAATVFADALRSYFDQLREIAREIDEEYASEPEPVVRT